MTEPSHLGEYEIRGTLGRGAMGVVYDGWDTALARRVAIKAVPLPPADDAEAQEGHARFRREAQAAGRLAHPNIVGVFRYGESDGLAYIVMEFVEGRTLKAALEADERMAVPEALRLMQDILAGLAFSHAHGVVHRDIKPGNVILTAEGRAKIADFGIARIESSNLTQVGTVMGTPAYMSPEQFMGQAVDVRSDIYSAGVLLYQLLTGDRPFQGNLTAIMHKALTTRPPKPSELSVNVPPALDGVVERAMARRPEDRFPSADAFAAALRQAEAAPGAPPDAPADGEVDALADATVMRSAPKPAAEAAAPGFAPASDPPPRRSRALPVAAAALLLAAAAGGAFWALSGHAPPPETAPVAVATRQALQPAPPEPASPPLASPPLASSPSASPAPAPPAAAPEPAKLPPQAPPPEPASPAPAPSAVPAEPATPAAQAPPMEPAPPAPAPPVTVPDQAKPAAPGGASGPAAPRGAAPPAATGAGTVPREPPATPLPVPDLAPLQLRIAEALAAMPCTLISGQFDDRGNGVLLRGLTGAGQAQSGIRQTLGRLAPAAAIDWQVVSFENPGYCGALDAIRPVAARNFGGSDSGFAIALPHPGAALRSRELLKLRVTTPPFATWLQVDYLQHDGKVWHMHPSDDEPARQFPPDAHAVIGEPHGGFGGWEVGEPYGRDMIIAVASTVRLFAKPRPVEEDAASYLAALQDAIAAAGKRGQRVLADALVVDTVKGP